MRRVALQTVRRALGRQARIDTPDRRLLEDVILPHYGARDDVRCVLFVGTHWYTVHYPQYFPAARFLTLDIDPRQARHGSPGGHLVASVTEVDRHLSARCVDLVVLNGVFGWGLDRREDAEQALQAIHAVLRDDGELVVGWNDVPSRRPFPFGELRALSGYEKVVFPPLGRAVVLSGGDNAHRFEFYRKAGTLMPAPTLPGAPGLAPPRRD